MAYLVSGVDLLEVGGAVVALAHVGVELKRQAPVGLLDLVLARPGHDSERAVWIPHGAIRCRHHAIARFPSRAQPVTPRTDALG